MRCRSITWRAMTFAVTVAMLGGAAGRSSNSGGSGGGGGGAGGGRGGGAGGGGGSGDAGPATAEYAAVVRGTLKDAADLAKAKAAHDQIAKGGEASSKAAGDHAHL